MLEIYMIDETDSIKPEIQQLVTSILRHAAKEEGISEKAEVSVTFMSDEEIKKVNAEYRDIDQPTDVISFALEEMSEGEVAIIGQTGIPVALGDIIISVDTAKRQAEEYGHDLNREIGFLALHGFLHLLGYDHLTKEDEVKMFGRQKEILHSYGLER
ncbi:rRNA maturation RNase YbeY [Sporosarcina jiandibaonis]|uniref:rRNA maturation RNase YbeY n=1 Tax=Sporosarcina jiandibaonis TaxID=2715535 RepID=UPI001553530F|nr:rRNA maturation RNase YbeY [Sporosarcina jiandibaonis]